MYKRQGRALAWDPGSNAFLGTFDLTLIDRGLLAGMDSNRYNQILTGRSGFFDFGGFTPPVPPPPAPVVAACVVEVINNVPVVSYSDFTNVSNVNILRNGSWIVNHTSETPGTGTYEDTSAVPGVAPRSVDLYKSLSRISVNTGTEVQPKNAVSIAGHHNPPA